MATRALIHKSPLRLFKWTRRKERNYPWITAVSITVIATITHLLLGLELPSDAVAQALSASVILGSVITGFIGASLAVSSGFNAKFKNQLARSQYLYVFQSYLRASLFSGLTLALAGLLGPLLMVELVSVPLIAAVWIAILSYCVTCLYRICRIMFVIFVDPDTH